MWHEVAYGRNAVYRHGHHGNAVLSRFPIMAQENADISAHAFESRGLLHCEIEARRRRARRCIASTCTSACSSADGSWQIRALVERINETVPKDAPMMIAGDFNDWRQQGRPRADRAARRARGVRGSEGTAGAHVPVVMPVFRLDRIYARGLDVIDARVHYALPVRPHVRSRRARGDVRGPRKRRGPLAAAPKLAA